MLFALLRVQDMDEDLPTFINHGLRVQSSDLPKVSVDDWELTLINRSHLQEESHPRLTQIDDIQVDNRIAENTRQFLAAARAIAPEETFISGYRSRAEQTELYEEALALAEEEGLSRQEAEQEVQKRIQLPGASEHQTGLAIDMSEPEGQNDEVANKIAEIAPKYGFILRYPEGKSDITGVDFENWHYRYVGVESAQYMQKHHLVLEEYLTLLKESAR
ncbi:serine-type D-Ala-D-Ala carboxypeptidase [Streptococcus cristatus ATCC 51100]|uniref:Serine-type D-Ala-D-Ala carboxypeptidase n=1 Tax=Streptococcus cristatus ATCC 51100 TaxID=889201 RepID=A0AAV3ED67_STRCR|nr:serine-type D-Ala-D-Ala carboxypeptidase [Streptococcus cristatus ATCC 51100]